MKVLFIGHNPEEDKNIIRMLSNNFPKIQLQGLYENDQLIDVLMSDGPFSFIIFNIDNKNHSVHSLCQKILEVLGMRPFVFIGSPNSIKSQLSNEMLQNQQTNFLIETPLKLDVFKKSIGGAIDWVKKEEFEESISEFSRDDLHPIRLRNFYLFESMPYDVYVELTTTKFGKVISKDKFFTHQLIQNYSKKNVKYFYLKKDEHLKFLSISIENLIKIYHSKLNDKKKYTILHLKTAFFFHQFIKAASISDEANELSHLFIESVSMFVRSNERLCELLDSINDGNQLSFAEQSVATSYICEKILVNMGWTAEMTRGKLILAALLQDINLNNDDLIKIRSLNDPNLKMFSEQEQDEFKIHPQKSAQLSTLFNGFSDVDFILKEQHEHPTGDGFPKGLNSSGLTTISCIFILASNFVSRMASSHKDPHRYKEILNGMKRVYNSGNFKDPLKALEKAIKN